MNWKIVKRKIGRAGSEKQRENRQSEWNRLYGEDNWIIGYMIDSDFVIQEDAFELVYYKSYESYFNSHPDDLKELISLAKILRNPHAEATTNVDLQIPAIMQYLHQYQIELKGNEIVDIGTFDGKRSHSISVRLSPLHIPCIIDPKLTLEQWWQSKKCLAIWVND